LMVLLVILACRDACWTKNISVWFFSLYATFYLLQCTYSINDCPVTHPSQLGNPFLGLPLESGKCESCGASENGKCEGSKTTTSH
jgi:hypothetical protein